MQNNKEKISISIDSALLERLKAMAEADNRKLSNLVETLLYSCIDE